MDSTSSSQKTSLLSNTILSLLENSQSYYWKGKKDVLKIVDPATQITYLIKIFDESQLKEQNELKIFTEMLNSDEGKLIFSGYQGVEQHDSKKYYVFKKQGMSLKKWKRKQKETENNNNKNYILQTSVGIAIQIINLAEILRKQGWNIADQLGSLLLLEDEDNYGCCSISIMPEFRQTMNHSETMKMVYNKYVNALAGRDIFPYPPEILSSVLDYEKPIELNPRKEIDEVWSIGVYLLSFVGNSEDVLLQLVEDDETKRKEPKKQQFMYQNELAQVIKKVFHIDPKMRWNLSQLKKELMSIQTKNGGGQIKSVGNIVKKDQSEGIIEIKLNQGDLTEKHLKEKLKKGSKNKSKIGNISWIKNIQSCELIQRMLKEEDEEYQKEFVLCSNSTEISTLNQKYLMKRDSKYQCFIQIKGILDSILKMLQKYQLQQQKRSPQKTTQLKEIKKCYIKALLFPFSISLGEFFWYAGIQAEQLGHLKFSKELFDEREHLLKALMDSNLIKQTTEISNDLLLLDPMGIGITLASAETLFRYGNKTQSLKLATKVLQTHPQNIPGLFLKGKVKSSFALYDQALECFQKCYELFNVKEERQQVDGKQFPWIPRKDQVDLELAKTYNSLGKYKEAQFHFELSVNESPHNVLTQYFLKLINQIDQPDLSNEQQIIKETLEPFSDEIILFELDKITKTISNKIQLLSQNGQKENNSNSEDKTILNQLKNNQELMLKRCEVLKAIIVPLTNQDICKSNPSNKLKQLADNTTNSEEPNQYSKLLTSSLEHWIYHANLKYKTICFLSHQKFSQEQKRDMLNKMIDYMPQTCYFSYQLARIYIKKKTFQKAEALLQKILDMDQNQPLIFFELGKLMIYSKKNFPLGVEFLGKSRSIHQKESEILSLLGRVEYKLGNFEKALNYFNLINDQSKQIEQELSIIHLTTGKCLLFLGRISEARGIFEKLSKQGNKQTTSFKTTNLFYKGICEHILNKLELPKDFVKNANLLTSKKKKALAMKIALRFEVNNDNEAEYSKIKTILESKDNDFLDWKSDGDVLALLSKSVLSSGKHPLLAMHYIELGLGAKSLFNENEKDNSPKTIRHFGCLVQEVAIEYELSKKNTSKLEDLADKLKTLIEEEKQLLEAKRQSNCLEGIQPIQPKQNQKESWCQIDWIAVAKMLLININITLNRFSEANLIISSFGESSGKEYYLELQYLNTVVKYESGVQKNDNINHLRLNTFIPSCFYYGQIQMDLRFGNLPKYHIEQANLSFEKTLKYHSHHLQAWKALGELQFSIEDYSLSKKYYLCYLDNVQQQNTELEILDLIRLDLPLRIISIEPNVLHNCGECFFQEKEYNKAIRKFESSLKIHPNQPTTLFWLGKSLMETGAINSAIHNLKQSKEFEKNPETSFLLGLCYYLSHDSANAQDNFLEVISLKSDHFLALRSLGEIYLQEKNFENAKRYFETCRKYKATDELTLIGLSDCAFQERDLEKADTLLKECLKSYPNSKQCFFRLIALNRESGKPLDLGMIQDHFSLFNNDILTLYYIGKTLFNEQKYSLAFKYFAEIPIAFKAKGKEEQEQYLHILYISHLRCAQIYYIEKKFSQSFMEIRLFKPTKSPSQAAEFDLIENESIQFQALFLQGTLRMLLNEKRVHYYFLQCMKIDPASEQPYFQFALYLWQKKSKDAWRYFKNGMVLAKAKAKDTSEYALLLQGLEVLDQGDQKIGEELLEKCSYKFPSCAVCYYELGRIKMEKEKYAKAIVLLKKSQECLLVDYNSISLFPEQLQQSYCYQAQALLSQSGQTSGAMKMINNCLALNPHNKAALEMKMQICYEDGQLSEAIKSAELSILTGETNPNTFNTLAVASMKQGTIFTAMQCLRKCQQLDQHFPLVNLKLAILYEFIARPHIALGYVLQHLALNPKAIQGLLRSTKLLAYSGKFQAAQNHLDRLFAAINDPNRQKIIASSSLTLKNPEKQNSKQIIIEDQNYLNDDLVQISQAHAVEGYLRKQEKRYLEAVVSYEEAFKLDANNESIMYSLAEVYSKLGNHEQEIKLYEQLTLLFPNSKQSQNYWNNLGNNYLYQGKIEQSIESYQKAIELNEDQSEIQENLAAGYIIRKEFNTAKKILENILFKWRYNVTAYYLYGQIYQSKGELINATKYFEQAIKTDDTFLPTYLSLAQIKIIQGNPKEAISLASKCLSSELNNLSLKAGIFLVDCYVKANEPWEAIALCESILEKTKSNISRDDSKNIEIKMNIQLARVHHKLLGESQNAVNLLKQCLLEQPEQPEYLHELGTILVQSVQHHSSTDSKLENLNNALEYFRQASNAEPTNAIYQFSIANVLHRMHNYELEVKSLLKCLNHSLDFKDQIFNNLALAYQHLHLADKARKYFQKGFHINPKSSRLHFNFANFLASQNDYLTACQEYEACLAIESTHLGALHNLARISVQLNNFQLATDCFNQCLRLHPKGKELYAGKITILLKKGYYPQEWIAS